MLQKLGAEPAKVLANARTHDLVILKLVAKKAPENYETRLRDLIVYLSQGDRRTFYRKLLSDDTLRSTLGLGDLTDDTIEKLARNLDEARTINKARGALDEAGIAKEAAETLDEIEESVKKGKH